MNGEFRRATWVVFAKEIVDGIRDRRSIFSALLYPLVGPLLIGLMFGVIADQQREADDLELPVEGAQHAAPLVDHLRAQGIEVVAAPAEPELAVAEGEVAMVLIIPPDFAEHFERLEPAPVQLVVDRSRNDTRADARRVQGHVRRWAGEIGGLRLVARGVSPEVASPVALEEVDVATPEEFSANVLNFIPMFIVLAAFIGGMQVAIDTTAGERERKSLEPLLTTPVPRLAAVLGKWLAACLFGAVGVLLTVACCMMVVSRLPLEELGLALGVGAREGLGLAAAALPVVPFAVGLQMLLGTFARSYKEAQTYMSLLVLLPMIPGMLLSLYPVDGVAWMKLVPSFGQQLVMIDVLGRDTTGLWGWWAAGSLITVGAGLAFVAVTARLFAREKIVFG